MGITQSIIKDWGDCTYKFLCNVNKIEHVGMVTKVNFGNMFHYILEYFYNKKPLDLILDKQYSAIETICSKLLDDYKNQNAEELRLFNPRDFQIEKGLAIALFLGYYQFYSKDFRKFKIKDVEYELKANYRGVKLRGKVDLIFKFPQSNSFWQMEHKTKGRISENNILKLLHNDFQAMFYNFILRRVLKLDIGGVLYNVIRKPQLRQKKTESLSDFTGRVYDDICSRPEHYYKRFQVIYSEKDMDEFQNILDTMLEEIDKTINGELGTYKNTNGCEFPFPCKYLDLCSTHNLQSYIIRDKLFPELEGGA